MIFFNVFMICYYLILYIRHIYDLNEHITYLVCVWSAQLILTVIRRLNTTLRNSAIYIYIWFVLYLKENVTTFVISHQELPLGTPTVLAIRANINGTSSSIYAE